MKTNALAALLVALFLSACGGGGGGGDGTGGLNPARPPASPPPPAALTLNANAVQVEPNATAEVSILSGTAPYTVTSSAQSVAQAVVATAPARIVVTGGLVVRGSAADLTVTDAAGKTATVQVTVSYPELSLSPSALSLNEGDTAPFTVHGGVPPYRLSTTHPSALTLADSTLSARGSSTSATARAVTPQPAAIVVTDAVGTSVSMTATVSAVTPLLQSLTVTPSAGTAVSAGASAVVQLRAATTAAGRQVRFERNAGAWRFEPGPGVAFDGSSALVTIDIAGQAFARLKADANAVTQSAVVRATDTASASFIDSVFAIAGTALGVTPDTFVAQNGSAACGGQEAAFQVFGGQPPYLVASTRPTSAEVLTPNVAASGDSFLVRAGTQCDGTSGPTNVYVRDAAGASALVKFHNVGGAPSSAFAVSPTSMSLVVDQTSSFALQNGTPPFTATSSNTAVATVTAVPGSAVAYNVQARAEGTALINIVDATAQAVSVSVTVAQAPTLTITPASASARTSAGSVVFVVTGGRPPYSAVSSVPAVATVAETAPGQFTATLGTSTGTTTIIVQDDAGQVVTASLSTY